jgi:hypothetical protein
MKSSNKNHIQNKINEQSRTINTLFDPTRLIDIFIFLI